MKILLYSQDDYFLNQISNYISRTQKEIQVVVYNDIVKAHEYLQQDDKLTAVLATNEFYQDIQTNDVLKVILDSRTDLSNTDGYYKLNIYQQGEDIVRDLKKICVGKANIRSSVETKSKVVTFFSLQGGSGQSTIAYQLAANMAAEKKVLYISFDYINAYQMNYVMEHPLEMNQLMFNSKDKKITSDSIYQAIMHNRHNIYVLPPFQTIGDIVELSAEDVLYMLEAIQALNEFDYIFLDLQHNLNKLNQELLNISDKNISVYTDDTIGDLKYKQFISDPYMNKLNMLFKTIPVRSKSFNMRQSNDSVYFPFVQLGTDMFQVCCDNAAFKQSCNLLKEGI